MNVNFRYFGSPKVQLKKEDRYKLTENFILETIQHQFSI